MTLSLGIRRLPDELKRSLDKENTYESQGTYHSAYFIINPDSSFVYYSVFEVGYHLSLGNYLTYGDTIIFNTDLNKTSTAVKDSGIYNQYFKHSYPSPYLIENEKYLINENEMK
jgi:hypothetical protein